MTRRILIIFIFTLIIFGMSKTLAVELDEINNSKIEAIIPILEMKKADTWEEVKLEKYTSDKSIIYKLENNSKNIKTTQEESKDARILRIIKNGYQIKTPADIGTAYIEDAYTATKLAIESILNRIPNRGDR